MGLQGLGCRCSDTPEMRAEQLHEGEGAQHAPPSKTVFPLLLPPPGDFPEQRKVSLPAEVLGISRCNGGRYLRG